MNKILLVFTLIFVVNFGYSQSSLLIEDMHGDNVVDDTVYVIGDANAFEIVEEFVITNTGSSTITVKAKKEEISMISGTESAFCWVLCYSTSVFVSNFSNVMDPGEFTVGAENLSGHYYAHGFTGSSTIKYTVFDANTPTDEASVTVVFDAITDVDDINANSIANNVYPNPANKSTTFEYNLDGANGVINLYNILGKKVGTYKFDGNRYILDTSKLYSGTYLYTITVDGEVKKTDRLLIAH